MYKTADGYIMDGQRLQHITVWEEHSGQTLPPGYVVHHRNEDRADNRIENLEAMTRGDHQRLHAGWIRDDAGAFVAKVCRNCKQVKPLDAYYKNYLGERFRDCRECSRVLQRRRKELKRMLGTSARQSKESVGVHGGVVAAVQQTAPEEFHFILAHADGETREVILTNDEAAAVYQVIRRHGGHKLFDPEARAS